MALDRRARLGDIVSPHYPGCLAAVVIELRARWIYTKQYDPDSHPLNYIVAEPIWEGWAWSRYATVRFLHNGRVFNYSEIALYPNER